MRIYNNSGQPTEGQVHAITSLSVIDAGRISITASGLIIIHLVAVKSLKTGVGVCLFIEEEKSPRPLILLTI
jgi:hypothetical protein